MVKTNKQHMQKVTQIFLLFFYALFSLGINAQEDKQNSMQELVERARKAGLDDDRIAKFLDLIKQKEEALLEIKNANSDESVYGVLESPLKKTNTEVRIEFAKNLADLISREEYLAILEEEIKKEAAKHARKEMAEVEKAHELTLEQKREVYAFIAHYHLNEAVIRGYYVFDKKLKKQKLTALKFYFEKNYKKLMEGFGIEIGASKKPNTNTFQY